VHLVTKLAFGYSSEYVESDTRVVKYRTMAVCVVWDSNFIGLWGGGICSHLCKLIFPRHLPDAVGFISLEEI